MHGFHIFFSASPSASVFPLFSMTCPRAVRRAFALCVVVLQHTRAAPMRSALHVRALTANLLCCRCEWSAKRPCSTWGRPLRASHSSLLPAGEHLMLWHARIAASRSGCFPDIPWYPHSSSARTLTMACRPLSRPRISAFTHAFS
jgi:hypothetical protein